MSAYPLVHRDDMSHPARRLQAQQKKFNDDVDRYHKEREKAKRNLALAQYAPPPPARSRATCKFPAWLREKVSPDPYGLDCFTFLDMLLDGLPGRPESLTLPWAMREYVIAQFIKENPYWMPDLGDPRPDWMYFRGIKLDFQP